MFLTAMKYGPCQSSSHTAVFEFVLSALPTNDEAFLTASNEL
jgi:hypothetical protein